MKQNHFPKSWNHLLEMFVETHYKLWQSNFKNLVQENGNIFNKGFFLFWKQKHLATVFVTKAPDFTVTITLQSEHRFHYNKAVKGQ